MDQIKEILNYLLPMIVIVLTIISSIRITFLLKHSRKIKFYEELMHIFFMIYLLLLFYIVTFQDINYGESNYTLFKEITRYEFGSRLFFKNIIGNILLFVPLGIFVCHYLKPKKYYSPLVITFISSLTIEFTQLKIGRTFDIDDILLNVIGGLVGYTIYKLFKHLPKFTQKTWFLNTISIIIMMLLVLYLLKTYNLFRFMWEWIF